MEIDIYALSECPIENCNIGFIKNLLATQDESPTVFTIRNFLIFGFGGSCIAQWLVSYRLDKKVHGTFRIMTHLADEKQLKVIRRNCLRDDYANTIPQQAGKSVCGKYPGGNIFLTFPLPFGVGAAGTKSV